jgi:hypothetical protein
MKLLLKSSVKGYYRKDGTWVQPYTTKRTKKAEQSSDFIFEEGCNYVLTNGKKEIADKIEFCYVYDAEGNVLCKKRGGKCFISFTTEEKLAFKNALGVVLIHNHPSGYSLSKEDLWFAYENSMDKVVAVCEGGREYSGKIKKVMLLDKNHFFLDKWLHDLQMQHITEGRLSIAEAENCHYHVVNSILRDIGAIEYEAKNPPKIPNIILSDIADMTKFLKKANGVK